MSCSINISAPGTGSLLSGETSDFTDGDGAGDGIAFLDDSGIDPDFLTEQELRLINMTEIKIVKTIIFFIIQN